MGERYEIDVDVCAGDGSADWYVWDKSARPGSQIAGSGQAPDEATARDIAALVVARLEGDNPAAVIDALCGALDVVKGERDALRAELEALRGRIEAKAKAYDAEAERWGRINGRMIPEPRSAEFRALLTPEVERT